MTLDDLHQFAQDAGLTVSESSCKTAHVFFDHGQRVTDVQKARVERMSRAELAKVVSEAAGPLRPSSFATQAPREPLEDDDETY